MALKQQIQKDLVEASKKQDDTARLALRSLLAEIGKKEIETGKRDEGLKDAEVEKLVFTELKKRKEAAQQYKEAGRNELADNEEAEAEILSKYAPEQMTEDEIQKLVDDIIKETGAEGMGDMGSVMKATMARAKGKADGSVVKNIVKQTLQG